MSPASLLLQSLTPFAEQFIPVRVRLSVREIRLCYGERGEIIR